MTPKKYIPYHQRNKQNHKPSIYKLRDILLQELGYTSYLLYLQSGLWHAIRRRVYKTHGRTCLLCPRPAKLIHHLSYDRPTLLGTDLSQLSPLCKICHRRVEFRKGHKRSFTQAQITYSTMRTKRIEQLKALATLRDQ